MVLRSIGAGATGRVRLTAVAVASTVALLLIALVGTPLPASAANGVPASFTFTGAGWGHGVGMSQYGAYAMASEGRTAAQIIQHYFSGASVSTVDTHAEVRVQVLEPRPTTAVRADGGPARVRVGDTVVTTLADGQTASVAAVPEGLRITAGDQTWTTEDPAGSVLIEWAATRYLDPGHGADVALTVAGAPGIYRHGRVEMRSLDGGVNAVNTLRLTDEYLYGIAEMPSSWPTAALSAQAIAARSYALATKPAQPRPACDCHFYDDTRSQNFTGWLKENEPGYGARWTGAVDATIGGAGHAQVATHSGRTVQAYYYSSSGGRTQNSEEVWSAALPYLRSVADPWSLTAANPYRSWVATVPQDQVAAAFGLRDVADLRGTGRTAGGGLSSVRAVAANGDTAIITGEQLRSRLKLRSTWISAIDASPVTTDPEPDPDAPVERLAGEDRYATAARVTQAWGPGVGTVYVTTGAGYADALTGSALAASQDAPVLLTKADVLPEATRDELERLDPQRIVVLGGPAAVSVGVERELAPYAGTGGVGRLSGTDRYATAADIGAEWEPGVATVYVATGAGYADALTGSALAGSQEAPVLLTKADVLPQATREELDRLDPQRIVVLGGPAAVSAAVERELAPYAGTGGVGRMAGADRYATAMTTTQAREPGVATVYLATGEDYADALVGSALAGSEDAPVLLTKAGVLPEVTREELERLDPQRVIILGGTTAVSTAVEVALEAYVP